MEYISIHCYIVYSIPSGNWSTGSSQIDAGSTGMVLSASQPVNKSLLVWAGNVLHRNIIDYSE